MNDHQTQIVRKSVLDLKTLYGFFKKQYLPISIVSPEYVEYIAIQTDKMLKVYIATS